ncbi:twin transmembrane helix small protein [Simiduia agarivorans]|uniref:DUF2909 domain-containing protein n=1 Tax=Simiduia agarivorans (strain DSM 21679 / JCM 13881 / BCRC 17597 / SA1) TaxID=1117647 RepID=K4KNC2_SIMAS|nr:twin transmembrane helix small protein [Simiduia agarivorans]AFU99618.2 hypothetical protein M5M_12290 [Simiduia agarivorans SA1 = DSM 21679]
MWLKAIIVLLFLAVLASLSSGLVFLLKDIGQTDSRRTLYALGIRVSLAACLLAAIAWGFYSGELASTAPWDRALR